ncbi:cobalamin biosynthesis protein [Amaricoccus sp.]|uniref:cobalamin biosynthesis protein n=1 Tax=Amaricoccus sp. TaxID=1872485 RepID=UPI001B6D11F9|nr:cobalamin biosynthesis protein [Amaricoccus sp.]MBP7243317.1 cobalamin biosynthesis protein [Amaricoccus sp.]
MTVAGIGCRRGATAEEVLAAIAAARARHGLARLDALAALDRKRGETGIAEAAARLGLPLLIAEPAGDAPGMLTRSAASLAATGTGSASEAAALAAAGPGARLLGPRLVLGPVTCALAEGEAS